MSTLDEYTASVLSYDDDMYIGYLIWYSVPTSVYVPYIQFNKKLLEIFGAFETNLSLPRAPKAHDVFKRACSDVGKLKTELDGGHVARYLIHDAGSDSYGIYREVVKEVLDKEGHTLSHETLGKLTYIRAGEDIDCTMYDTTVDTTDQKLFEHIEGQVQEYFTKNKNNIASAGIRYIILGILHNVLRSYTARSSGGVYFVKKDFGQYLEPLSELLDSVTSEDGLDKVQFHYLPLVDDKKQREMLKAAFTADVTQRCNEIATECAALLKSDNKITSARFASIHEKFTDVKALIGDQQDMLQDGLDNAEAAAKLLNAQVVQLIKKVK